VFECTLHTSGLQLDANIQNLVTQDLCTLRLGYVNTLQRPWLVTAGLLGRDVSCLNLMYCLDFCLEGLRKSTEPPAGRSGLQCGPEIPQAVRSKVSYATVVLDKKRHML
jgi:hypothetical protein